MLKHMISEQVKQVAAFLWAWTTWLVNLIMIVLTAVVIATPLHEALLAELNLTQIALFASTPIAALVFTLWDWNDLTE